MELGLGLVVLSHLATIEWREGTMDIGMTTTTAILVTFKILEIYYFLFIAYMLICSIKHKLLSNSIKMKEGLLIINILIEKTKIYYDKRLVGKLYTEM